VFNPATARSTERFPRCTTAFSTRSSAKPAGSEPVGLLVALLFSILVALLGLAPASSHAQAARSASGVAVVSAELQARDDPEPGLYVNAQFDFETSSAVEDAVQRGIPVYFAIDFELLRSRWYWFDRQLVSSTLVYRITYSPLTRQFRLSRGALAQPFESLAEALATVRTVRNWRVGDRTLIRPDGGLQARLRLRLDTSMLPKPFQVDTLTNRDWLLASDWQPVRVAADAAASSNAAN
jgi:hypothetical protein